MYEKVLFKLNEFCLKNKIEYAVTGTCALELLGIPSSFCPKGVDIVIYHPTDDTIARLKELEDLSGLKEAKYPDSICYSFLVRDVKVNAIVDPTSSYEDMRRDTTTLHIIDNEHAKHHLISVHLVWKAWAAKIKLGRAKDVTYVVDVINHLSAITDAKTHNA